MDLEDLANLIGLGTAIKDDEITIEESFQAPAGDQNDASSKGKLRDRLGARRAETKTAEGAAQKEPEPEPEAKEEKQPRGGS